MENDGLGLLHTSIGNEFLQELGINKHMLDVELINQPRLFFKYAEEYSKKTAELEAAKEGLEVLYATLDKEVRLNLEGTKYTEAVVRNTILADKRYREASTAIIELREETAQLNNAKTAFEHRKSALESLVRLYIAGYFSDVHLPGKNDVIEKERDFRRQDTSEELKSSRMKRK